MLRIWLAKKCISSSPVKLKLDENIPVRVGTILREMGHDADTVVEEGLNGREDGVILEAASEAERMVITLDRGFPVAANLSAIHPGVVVLRLLDQSVPAILRVVHAFLSSESLDDLCGCLVVVSPTRARIRCLT